ncbi:hypothetical protein CUMW_106340, partial [Citrus unshiu]
ANNFVKGLQRLPVTSLLCSKSKAQQNQRISVQKEIKTTIILIKFNPHPHTPTLTLTFSLYLFHTLTNTPITKLSIPLLLSLSSDQIKNQWPWRSKKSFSSSKVPHNTRPGFVYCAYLGHRSSTKLLTILAYFWLCSFDSSLSGHRSSLWQNLRPPLLLDHLFLLKAFLIIVAGHHGHHPAV